MAQIARVMLYDENNNPVVGWQPNATDSVPGVIKVDGTTITSNNGTISASGGANTDLSNLTDNGNAKFQYAPFSINNGTVNTNGQNVTLHTPEGSISSIEAEWNQPVLTSNGILGEGDFAVSGVCEFGFSMYQMFNGGSEAMWFVMINRNTPITMYFGDAVKISSFSITNGTGNSDGNRAFRDCAVDVSSDGETWTQLVTYTNTAVATGTTWELPVNSDDFYNYYRIRVTSQTSGSGSYPQAIARHIVVNGTYMAKIATGTDLICDPCTITTADNNTTTFQYADILDCSNIADDTYKVMKSYTNGALSLSSSLKIAKTSPINETLWIQSVLSANGTMGGDSFACSASDDNVNAYKIFDNDSSTSWNTSNTYPVSITFYNPTPIKVSTIAVNCYNSYYFSNYTIFGSNDNLNWDTIISGTATAQATINVNSNNFYKYYKVQSNNSPVTCYSMDITATYATNAINDDLWLDTSSYPLRLKQYDGINWQVKNDLVYVGDVTIANGIITAVSNNEFNKYGYLLNDNPKIIETYQNGTSWYRVYSDGWCEQGGLLGTTPTSTVVTLLKPYPNTNYLIFLAINSTTNDNANTYIARLKTVNNFSIGTGVTFNGMAWKACGYIS